MARVYSTQQLEWRGDELHLRTGRKLLSIVADAKYPQMWRVRYPDGTRTRAKDAACALALRILNREERPLA
jgi:hypothetical protein